MKSASANKNRSKSDERSGKANRSETGRKLKEPSKKNRSSERLSERDQCSKSKLRPNRRCERRC